MAQEHNQYDLLHHLLEVEQQKIVRVLTLTACDTVAYQGLQPKHWNIKKITHKYTYKEIIVKFVEIMHHNDSSIFPIIFNLISKITLQTDIII